MRKDGIVSKLLIMMYKTDKKYREENDNIQSFMIMNDNYKKIGPTFL